MHNKLTNMNNTRDFRANILNEERLLNLCNVMPPQRKYCAIYLHDIWHIAYT